MKLHHFLALALALFAFAAGNASAQDAAEDKSVALYNGKDLTGWNTTGNWVVEPDGVLAIIPREGEEGWKRYDAYLTTERKYADFEITLDYQHDKGGNSGLYFCIQDDADPVKTGIEIQILDSHGKADDELTHHDNGGIIKTSPAKVNASKPAGEWNTLKARLVGTHLKAWLNGKLIHDLDLAEHDATKGHAAAGSGYVSLQDHGLEMRFRNIRITELK